MYCGIYGFVTEAYELLKFVVKENFVWYEIEFVDFCSKALLWLCIS